MADRIEGVPALLVIGAPGSGKTALIKEISECLYRTGEHHAVIDLDELCRGVLPEADDDFLIDLAVENLRTVWGNFRRRGARRLVMARVVRSTDDLDAIISAVPDCEVTVCRLSVGADTVQSRLRQREAGSSFDFLAGITATVAGEIAALEIDGPTLVNEPPTTIEELAARLLTIAGWPNPTP